MTAESGHCEQFYSTSILSFSGDREGEEEFRDEMEGDIRRRPREHTATPRLYQTDTRLYTQRRPVTGPTPTSDHQNDSRDISFALISEKLVLSSLRIITLARTSCFIPGHSWPIVMWWQHYGLTP